MNPESAADTAVLVSAILTLVAIAAKLITANLVTRAKRIFLQLDARRREIVARLKESQLKTTSARGTLEFWERRRTETSQRVQDIIRDLEAYQERSSEVDEGEDGDLGATGGDILGTDAADADSDVADSGDETTLADDAGEATAEDVLAGDDEEPGQSEGVPADGEEDDQEKDRPPTS